MEWNANWIRPIKEMGDVCPVYIKEFAAAEVQKAELFITAMGVYEAVLNGMRVGSFVLAPGWTSFKARLQVQCYDVTELLKEENQLEVTVGRGWYRSPIPGWIEGEDKDFQAQEPPGLTADLKLTFADGSWRHIVTDEKWLVKESKIRFSEIYDGEVYDATFEAKKREPVECFEHPIEQLILQQGEEICEQEIVAAARLFITPAGETVVDFGQEVTGYIQFTVEADAGEEIEISHGEVLDKHGNFYNANYRGAKARLRYICRSGKQVWKPKMTFFGFRYIRLDKWPGQAKKEQFIAIVVHSEMKRTGFLTSSDPLLNQLFSNIVWGQKGNFLDIPTDCPQRDERLGWTGDAQVFVKTASYTYDVEKFFTKWLADMAADQLPDGSIPHVVPQAHLGSGSAAWDDAAVICPWQIYLTYGNPAILQQQFDCMKKYIGFITDSTKEPYLWIGGTHFGDWLGLDSPVGSCKGSSRADLIATAFYARSTFLVIKAGKVLGEDVKAYEDLYNGIVEAFQKRFSRYYTQTEYVLALHFRLAKNLKETAASLAKRVIEDGCKLQTGFVGTPYLLHVLSDYGYTKLAYCLLLRREYPSWLYPITRGATTIWEHWDGIMENGDFWSEEMNSFNHYAYGAVADWVYEVAAGITPVEEAPGFAKVKVAPHADSRLEWLEASIDTRYGFVRSRWNWVNIDGEKKLRYEITVPSPALIVIDGKEREVDAGTHIFFGE